MQPLTDRQRAVFDYIRHSIVEHGYPPTLREIGIHLGIRSTNGVNDHLRALQRKGYLTREDMKSRTLRLVSPDSPNLDSDALPQSSAASRPSLYKSSPNEKPFDQTPAWVEVPIVGRVAAGLLSEAIEHPEDKVLVDRMLLRNAQEVFGLRIVGDSMIDAGIFDGDYVFVRKQLVAKRGEVVVALVGNDATCKYYFPEKDYVRLQPANASMAPILIPHGDWRSTQILGVVVGVYRKLE